METKFTEGGVNVFQDLPLFPEEWGFQGRQGFVGWMGFGGSVFQWHSGYRVGFGYTSSLVDWTDLNNNKAMKMQKEVIESIQRIQQKGKKTSQRKKMKNRSKEGAPVQLQNAIY